MSEKKLHLTTFTDQMFAENAYVVWLREVGPCWIIDPGLAPSPSRIIDHIEKHKLRPAALLLTHGHLDHIAGVPDIMKAFPGLPIHMALAAAPALTDPGENLSSDYGAPVVAGDYKTIDLPEGETLELDGTSWRIIDTSGHAPGSRSFYCEKADIVIVGDALFAGSVGRVDFHHSNGAELIRNIREKLMTLPDETSVHSGHGPVTTVGRERATNPFIQDGADLDWGDDLS